MEYFCPAIDTAPVMASLYVGDLDINCTEAMLQETFSQFASFQSVKVCRDVVTGCSLGYAYVNFMNWADADMALEYHNCTLMMGKPMRVMWSHRDPAERKFGTSNVFIKNLENSIDEQSLYDTLSFFGRILSVKLARDDNGNSLGYGYIHFETDESACRVISKLDGMLFNGKKVHITKFVPRIEREKNKEDKASNNMEVSGEVLHAARAQNNLERENSKEDTSTFTKVFIRNFDMNKEQLHDMFSKFGKIISHQVKKDDRGNSKHFGFVTFEDPKSASEAVAYCNNKEVGGKVLFVARAQSKQERQAALQKRVNKKSKRNKKAPAPKSNQ